MQDNSAGGRNALCPGCPYRAPVAAMGRLWLRGVAGGGCAALCAGRPLLAVEERAGEWRAVSVLAQRLREGAKRSELIALLPAAELDGPALAELEESGGIALAVGSALPAGLAAGAITEVSAFDSAGIAAALRAALAREGAAVVFCRGECALTAPAGGKKYRVAGDYCRRCGACTRLGCPAIKNTRPPAIDGTLCAGCGVCAQLCPCGAIREA